MDIDCKLELAIETVRQLNDVQLYSHLLDLQAHVKTQEMALAEKEATIRALQEIVARQETVLTLLRQQ